MRLALVGLVGLVALTGGCAVSGPRDDPILDGYVDNGEFEATARYDALAGTISVDVEGHVRAGNTRGLAVDVFLAEKPCSKFSPTGEPASWVDRRVVPLEDPPANATVRFAAALSGNARVDALYHVYVRPHAENSIGPIFGLCRDITT